MKRVLLALLGLVLIGILTYFCFQNKIDTIRENLETRANNALVNNHINDAKAQLIGNDFETTTIMRLTGKAPSIELRKKAEQIVGAVFGVSDVDNQLIIVEKAESALISQPKIIEVEKVKPALILQPEIEQQLPDAPSPYIFDASKDEKANVVLGGYVDNEDEYLALITQAYKIFGKENITDNLKIAKGAPEHWERVTYIGLTKLKEVDYGEMKLHNTNYAFNGHLSSEKAEEIKLSILKDANTTMSKYSKYTGNFEISVPKPKPVKINNTKLCQKALSGLSNQQKILFEYNKADIKKDSIPALDNIVKVLQKCKFKKTEILEIGGHTDSIGNAIYNKKLSQKRADSVKKYLIKHGIDKSKLSSHGYGEKAPMVSNMLKAGRTKNRRIEFTIKGIK